MKDGEIVTVLTVAGEFVGKLAGTEDGVKLIDPRMVVQGPEGNMGFAKGICSTGKLEPESVVMNVVYVTPTTPEVEKGYREFTSGIALV